ncbi:hypothetical protein ACH5RR_022653 [Cinchona calisaya]|uniref:Protein kinase domain-containing protein n=1 Tax=Cinchona calisaya TaxID=153742 RepID=A0ABD2Z8D9_9GENT
MRKRLQKICNVMCCICSKGAFIDNKCGRSKKSKKASSKRSIASSRKEEVVVEVDNGANDATFRLILENVEKRAGSMPPSQDKGEKLFGVVEKSMVPQMSIKGAIGGGMSGGQPQMSRIFSVRNGVDGAQVVAGWPSWLTAAAGEAIKGWIPRKADSFEKLDKIGQGTYSSVYRARDLETGKIVALKKVRFVNMDPESVRFMAREILILRRLDHPNVMKLEGLITSRVSCYLYLVFEYMEHDLTGLATVAKNKFTEPQIKCYMQQLFRGLEHCHNRGVLHRDIKGSNLLIDNYGNLKIGDFGLATFFRANQKQPLTSRVVTLWYRPPELLLGATNYGPAVDLWSSGCILAELFVGKPIMPGRTEVEQLHKIFKLCGSPSDEYWKNSKLPHATIFKPQNPYKRSMNETFKDFSPSALTLINSLLAFEPECRGSTTSALQSEFFTTKPLPCEPSSLPKYPPSKEFDAKNRDEESKRQRDANSKGPGLESYRKGSKESKVVPILDANAELSMSIQAKSNPKSSSEKYNLEGDDGSGFPTEPFVASLNKESIMQRPNKFQGAAAQLSRFSNSVAARGSSHFDLSRHGSNHSQWMDEHINNAGSSHHLLGGAISSHMKDERALRKEFTMGYDPKKSRIHYSGPLLPPGGNIEEMLKEHEKRIQHAVRKARIDKK